MRISDWSSDVCSSDLWAWICPGCRAWKEWTCLRVWVRHEELIRQPSRMRPGSLQQALPLPSHPRLEWPEWIIPTCRACRETAGQSKAWTILQWGMAPRSEEHTSELQSLMRISYAVFCLKKKKRNKQTTN